MALPRLPEPDEAVFLVHAAEGQLGPMSRRNLVERLDAGAFPATAHLWLKGMEGWEPISAHEAELRGGLDAAPEPVPSAPRAGETQDDALDRVFGDLVRDSWAWIGDQRFASHVDEVFLGALITSTLDTGFALIDLSSDGTHHFLRFEKMEDRSRILFRMTHLTPSLAISKVLGQRASVVIGYGERVGNIAKIWSAIQAEMKSAYLRDDDPGTITVDGDVNSGYVYCNVDLFFDIENYVARDYTIDNARLSNHVAATTHALRKYLRGRFQ
jgi:hypothetical protein